MTTTVRVSENTRRRIAVLAKASGRQMQSIVDEAVAAYEKERFWRAFEAGAAVLGEQVGPPATGRSE